MKQENAQNTTENPNVVMLDTPIKRGDTVIESITMIRPNAGALRGVGLADVASSNVDALITVLPRITYPSLTKEECAALELPDFIALASKVIGFLAPNSAQ
ncbi:MAG: phage tail assembly protein [Rouxiella aceris]|uniref:Phage tail assembly protein n=1 Tax=Rouxiella aceris TaxID=2703884 RepID=A0A848MJG5_9GAMM|nr:phage tail assembly protein [Rouxiella aceris]MDR3434016.1 phage tail assembly protein [Rouxiella aceris]NMP27220.1 phage tail assembly protein [Rouxiella aceris]